MDETDDTDNEPMATFQWLYDHQVRLLAEIAAGKTKRTYLPVQIAAFEQERDRLKSLTVAGQAALDVEPV